MKIKSYYTPSIEAAMTSASQELGPDAVLITSRRTGPDARHLGEYEVVFGLANDTAVTEATQAAAPSAPESGSARQEIETVRREMEGLRRELMSAWRTSSPGHNIPELVHAETLLRRADIAPELTDDMLATFADRLRDETQVQSRNAARDFRSRLRRVEPTSTESEARAAGMIREWLEPMLLTDAELGVANAPNKIVALVGPPGAGKTSTLVKLAVQHGLNTRRPAMIISTDSYRVGASEQLRAFAAIIGVAFQVADTPAALGQLLEEHKSKDLILIDTPGLGPADMDVAKDMARFLSLHPQIQVHLVVPATLRSGDLVKTATRFAPFGPTKLIATRLDETGTLGAIVSQSILLDLPVSFVTTGQQIPDDIRSADKDQLLAFAACEARFAAVSAA